MVGVTRFDHRHDDWHHRFVVRTALTIEADERPAPADRTVDLNIRIDKISEVTDNDVFRIDTDVFEDIELLQGRFPRNAGMREDRDVRRKVSTTDGPKYLALVLGHVVPRSNR